MTSTTTSAKVMARMVSATDSFSSFSCTRALRRMPAVSTSRMFWPSYSQSTEMESRVMPASGPVSMRSSPIRRLIRVDLPALGRPMMAMRIGLSGSSTSSMKMSALAATTAAYRSAMPSPCSAEMATGSPKPSE